MFIDSVFYFLIYSYSLYQNYKIIHLHSYALIRVYFYRLLNYKITYLHIY